TPAHALELDKGLSSQPASLLSCLNFCDAASKFRRSNAHPALTGLQALRNVWCVTQFIFVHLWGLTPCSNTTAKSIRRPGLSRDMHDETQGRRASSERARAFQWSIPRLAQLESSNPPK